MTELWLKYRDESGEARKIRVEGSKFTIGRHSDCNLAIPNGKLSREHVKIESFGDVSVISDCGSSNGTTLNGADLNEPTALRSGDVLNLGGGLSVEVEIVTDQPRARKSYAADENSGHNIAANQSAANGSSIPTAVFIAAPVLALVFLVCGGGLLYFFNTGGGNNGRNTEVVYNPTPDDTPDDTPEKPGDSPTPKTSPTSGGATVSPSPQETTSPQATPVSDEKVKIEQNSAAFLRRIATNDATPFLKTAQIETVSSKIAAFKGSSSLAENLKAVKTNASEFESLAQSKGFKGQFLAIAALALIGNKSGNPLETAKQMLPFLADLRVSLGNALADDNLLIMADYPRRSANRKGSLQGVLEAIPKMKDVEKADAREIRTIWYLKRNKKISDEGYELALQFLAIGTISQNPRDFNVNAEAVIFN